MSVIKTSTESSGSLAPSSSSEPPIEPILKADIPPPSIPKTKISQRHFDALYRHECRQLALNLLREKYQLSFFECQGQLPAVVRERQRLYTEHLNRLKAIWDNEDRELEGKCEDG